MSEKLFNPYNQHKEEDGGVATAKPETSEDTPRVYQEEAVQEFERNREQAFAHAFEFDKSIAELEHEVALSESVREQGPEYEKIFQEQKHFLEQQREKQLRVAQYERMLWGESPEDHLEGKQRLLEDIALIESPQDVLALFDRWGALPGANTVDRPVIGREAVASFLSKIQERTDVPDLEKRAQRLFPNKRLREKVLTFVKRDPEVEARITELKVPHQDLGPDVYAGDDEVEAKVVIEDPKPPFLDAYPDVWDEEDEDVIPFSDAETDADTDDVYGRIEDQKPEPVIQQEREPEVDVQKEIRELQARERSLTEAQGIIDSPIFKYTPFLMRFTRKGREDLEKVKRAGFTLDTRGASPETLEMARSLKLKSVRERLAHLSGGAQAFAHDLKKRVNSTREATEVDYRSTNEVRKERALDSASLKSGDTRRENLKRIKGVLTPQSTPADLDNKKVHYEKDDGMTIDARNVNRFSAPIARRRRSGTTNVTPLSNEPAEIEATTAKQESPDERVTREALAVFNRKKSQKEALAKKVVEKTGRIDLSKKEVRAEVVKMRRKKKSDGTNN